MRKFCNISFYVQYLPTHDYESERTRPIFVRANHQYFSLLFPSPMAISLRADRLNHFRHHLSVVSEFRVLGIIELDPYLCVWIDIIFALHFYPSLY